MRWPIAVSLVAVMALYLARLDHNPPGFNFDESSVAYNAYTVSVDGRDEHGVRFPLFFEAFGEYKNPVYIYLLGGVFRIFEPGTLAARALSAVLGIATVLALAALAWRVTRSAKATLATILLAAATPMLFEISRLVLEATVFPLAVALFLLAARAAHDREHWSPALCATLAATLALVTYAYTAGRFLGPVFALLLVVLRARGAAGRAEAAPYVLTLFLYALTLIPAAIFNTTHPGAFFQHARDVALRGSPLAFVRNFVLNFDPINLAFIGDPNARHHVTGSGGSILAVTFILAIVGARLTWRSRWTTFLVLGLFASILPGALANGVAHTLRLSASVIFLIALGFPAMAAPRSRFFAYAMVLLGAFQAAWFFTVFHRDGANRPDMFDVGARAAIRDAIARDERPIYVEGRQYSHAYWFGALEGLDRSELRLLAPDQHAPPGALVYSDTFVPRDAKVIARHRRYTVFIAP